MTKRSAPPPPEPIPAGCFLTRPGGREYTFPVDRSRSYTLGVPVIQFEPVFRRGKIVRLLVTYTQTPNHGCVYAIQSSAESLWFNGSGNSRHDSRVLWCSHHKTAVFAVPMPANSFRITVGSTLDVWMDGEVR